MFRTRPIPAQRIYLDHAATTPIMDAARAAMIGGLSRWHNPNSPHAEGRAARGALEDARERIKRALGWPGELIFTSGASEALAIALGRSGRRALVSAAEHEAVFRAAPDAALLPLDVGGELSGEALDAALGEGPPPIVAIQHVNSELGVVQPVDQFAATVRAAGGLLLCDCSQSAGKLPLPDADMIVLSAHKLGGPPGIGALLVRDLASLRAVGGQEYGYRPGTQNVPGALGFAAALEAQAPRADGTVCAAWLAALAPAVQTLERTIEGAGGLMQPAACDPSARGAPRWILAPTMPGVAATTQLIRFDMAGIAVSAGSACSSGTLKASRTLAAFGVADDDAACTIRVSVGWSTTAAEIEDFAHAWTSIAEGARARAA